MKIVIILLLSISSLYSIAQKLPADSIAVDAVALIVKDLDKMSHWYRDKLGLQLFKEMNLPQYDSLQIHFLKRDKFMLELVGKRKAFSIKKYVPDYQAFSNPLLSGFNKISFRVQNIAVWYQMLQQKKAIIAAPLFEDKIFNLKSFITEDPEGNLVQFVEYHPSF